MQQYECKITYDIVFYLFSLPHFMTTSEKTICGHCLQDFVIWLPVVADKVCAPM